LDQLRDDDNYYSNNESLNQIDEQRIINIHPHTPFEMQQELNEPLIQINSEENKGKNTFKLDFDNFKNISCS